MSEEYMQFLKTKIVKAPIDGIKIDRKIINPLLKPHQKDIVQWSVLGGNRAIFAAFGLGKTFMQLEVIRILREEQAGKYLIICPLGVRQEFSIDAEKLGMEPLKFVKKDAQIEDDGIYLTNYESVRDGKIDPAQFIGVSLDEASCLRGYGTKTFQTFLTLFKAVKYKYVATATPAPNRFKELIHYAGFLGVMDTGQALTRFFQRDSTKANNLTLFPHMEAEFWAWMHSWAIFLQRPSQLGYSDKGYDLPPMDVIYHEIPSITNVQWDRMTGQCDMMATPAVSLAAAADEKRNSLPDRIDKAMEILNSDPDSNFILWHDLEDERRAIKKALPDAVEIYGSQDIDIREKNVIAFSNGEIQYLATKPVLSGSGCNFQKHCHKMIFLGVGYKFNDFIQAIHRVYRFMQEHQVEIHIIHTEKETQILDALKEKWTNHDYMAEQTAKIIKQYGIGAAEMAELLQRSIGIERKEESGDGWVVANNDCVEECKVMEDDSVDMVLTSIPFGNHYEYSASYNDFGHNENYDRFFEQMDHLSPELMRVLKPGRVYACHVKDRINFGNTTGMGMPTVEPLHANTISHYIKHGFAYFGMITIVTDVVRENNQTYRLGWTEQCKDGSKMGVGSPEYVLLFRKLPTDTSTAYADEPVQKNKEEYTRAQWQVDAHSFWRSSGNRQVTSSDFEGLNQKQIARLFTDSSLSNIYDYETHVDIGKKLDEKGSLPSTFMTLAPGSSDPDVWHDVNRMRTLNGEQTRKGLVNHICPLQFDIVDRLINRYTNKDDVVFDPFGGLMTVPLQAVKLGRQGKGSELNPTYFRDGVAYLRENDAKRGTLDLFSMIEMEARECS